MSIDDHTTEITLPLDRIGAAGEATAPGSLDIESWKAQAFNALMRARVDPAPALDVKARAHRAMDVEADCIVRYAQTLRDYALECRAARWNDSPTPLVANGLYGTVYECMWLAWYWVMPKIGMDMGKSIAEDLKTIANTVARHANVPPPVDRALARDGYNTAEVVAEFVYFGARMLIDLYDDVPAHDPHAERARSAASRAKAVLRDVPIILREGVEFTLGIPRDDVPIDPAAAGLWTRMSA